VWYNRLRMDTRKTPAARALVTTSYSGYYIFERSGDGATGVARLKRGAFRSRDPLSVPVTGDFVELEPNPAGESRILSVCPRKTAFIRRDPSGSGRRAQVLAANFDYVFIFAGCDRPFAPGRLERAFALSRQSGAEAVVVLSKADLADARELEELAECARRAAPGAAVVPLSSKTGAGVETLRALLAPGRVAVLLGESGAGKSTLLNALAGKRVADTGEVRAKDAKGRHTTTAREFSRLPSGGAAIDTPGLREIGLHEAAEGIGDAFADVESLFAGCRFSDCSHGSEPGCAVRAAIEDGSLDPERWESYLKYSAESRSRGRERRGGWRKARR